MTDDIDPLMKLSASRWWAIEKCPYFASALFALTPKETTPDKLYGMETIAVTKTGVLLYTPKALDKWTLEELGTALIHEVLHILRDHHDRAKDMTVDPTQWNIAADMEINDDIREMRLALPANAVYPDTAPFKLPTGLTAEEYYQLLNSPENQKKMSKIQKGLASGACGSGAGNPPDGEPEDEPGEGKSEAQLKNLANQTAAAIKEHAQAHGIGNMPGGLMRWAEAQLGPPFISWQQQLKQSVKHAVRVISGHTDQTHTRIARRQAGIGIGVGKPVLAASITKIPRVAVAVDTSGSMAGDDLQAAIGEIQGILSVLGAPTQFIACDTEITVGRIRTVADTKNLLKGGGGTEFTPMFNYVKEKKAFDLLIVFTDGYVHAPPCPPKVKVIWCITGGNNKPSFGAEGEYGTIIHIADKRKQATKSR